MGKYKSYSDLEVFERIRNYDSRALEEIYDRYSGFLFSLLVRITGDKEEAGNLLVRLFEVIWRKSEKFDAGTENVFVWLTILARNIAVDEMKRKRGSDDTGEYDDRYEDKYIIPFIANDIDRLDFAGALSIQPKARSAFSRLTEAQKYVIELSFYEGRTIREISKKLNIPVETVRNKVMTAMNHFRDNLLDEK